MYSHMDGGWESNKLQESRFKESHGYKKKSFTTKSTTLSGSKLSIHPEVGTGRQEEKIRFELPPYSVNTGGKRGSNFFSTGACHNHYSTIVLNILINTIRPGKLIT